MIPTGDAVARQLQILHLEDNATDGELVRALLEEEGIACSILRVETREAFDVALRRGRFDLIISDFTLPSFDGLSALALARTECPDTAFIFVSGTIGEELAVDSLKEGAVDYILKDRISRLPAAVRRAVRETRERLARRGAEERLRQQAALLDKATDAIMVHDQEGRITYWNPAAERIYGWKAEEILGRRGRDFFAPGLAQAEAMQAEEWSGEVRHRTRDSREVILSSRRKLLRDPAGVSIAVLEINTDVTERKRLEAQLLRSQRLESLGSLAGGIAHDLNNVLSPVVMAAELLETQAMDEVGRRMLSIIRASATRGSGLVRQILSFSRGASAARGPVEMAPVISEVARLCSDTFPKNVQIEAQPVRGLSPVVGDATQLHQVLLNLCVNARDAMPEGGRLTIEAAPVVLQHHRSRWQPEPVSGSFLVLCVIDTGTGISTEHLGRIFEPFFTTKAPDRGTGLGLSTVAAIVKDHGGFIEVDSEPGHGTTFRVYLPAVPPSVAAGALAAPGRPLMDLPSGGGEQILLVDDELAVREMTKEMLESFRYRVLTAGNGTEAISIFLRESSRIDLVITDLAMPVTDGTEVIRALRATHPGVRILCISGLSEAEEARIDPAEFPTLIQKPFTAEQLLTAVRGALSRGEPAPDPSASGE
jgi:PAS domain S-box-containing protein